MGCHCAKDRSEEAEPESQRESLALCERRLKEEKRVEVKPMPSPLSRRKTVLLTASPVVDPIHRLSVQLRKLYVVDSVIRRWDAHSLSEAEFVGTKQKCFLKTIEKFSGRTIMQQRAKLAAEAERLNKLDHPYVLRTYELMQDDSNFYLASEPFFEGQLQEYLTDQTVMTEAFAARVMYQVFTALAYCHKLGIVHGNICPENIVLLSPPTSEKMRVRLTGFGEYDSICPASKEKLAYSPPEPTQTATEKGDIWSCGILLYQLLTSQMPFAHVQSTAGRSRRRSSTSPLINLEGKGKPIKELLTSMLDHNPDNRPTAAMCKSNPWLKQFLPAQTLKTAMINQHLFSLKKLRCRNPLQEAVLKFILLRVLSPEDLEVSTEAFFHLDKDEDGILNEEELRQSFASVMPETDARNATKRVMDAIEHNGSNVIGFSEFVISSLGEKKLMSPGNLRTVFGCFERNGSGHISLQELKSVFSVRNSSERERQWRELILQASSMASDSIDYGEFTSLTANFNPNS